MLRPDDIAGRIGGEEFSIYLNGIQDEAQLQHVIDTLLERIRTIRLPQLQKTLTISIGCCLVEHAQVCFHDVYERSDQALYRARKKVEIRLLFVQQPTSKLASRLYVLHVKA